MYNANELDFVLRFIALNSINWINLDQAFVAYVYTQTV